MKSERSPESTAARGAEQEATKNRHPLVKAAAIGAIGLAAVGVAGFNGFKNGLPDLGKDTAQTEGGEAVIKNIDLELSEVSYTAYTQDITAKARIAKEVFGMDAYFKSDQVEFEAETKMTMAGNTAEKHYDKDAHHVTVKIDSKNITAGIDIVPGTIKHTTDGNLAAAAADNLGTSLKAIPWLGDLSMLDGITTATDKSASTLGNMAMVEGLYSASKTCVSKAWPVLHESFADGVAENLLGGLTAIDPTFTRDDITVLIGDAKTEAENEQQIVGKVSSVDKAHEKLMNALSDADVEVSSKPGSCELSDELKEKYAPETTDDSVMPVGKSDE